jgi:hypothetical protein
MSQKSIDTVSVEEKIRFSRNIIKQSSCKICSSFDDEDFYDITMDVVFGRRSWVNIQEYYTKKLPAGVKPINPVNLARHKKHAMPQAMANYYLEATGDRVDAQTFIDKYKEIFRKKLETNDLAVELNMEQLQSCRELEEMYDVRAKRFDEYIKEHGDIVPYEEFVSMQDALVKLKISIAKTKTAVQKIVNDMSSSTKDVTTTSNTIVFYNNFISSFENDLRQTSRQIAAYIVTDLMKDEPERAKEFAHQFLTLVAHGLGKYLDAGELRSIVSIKPPKS